MRGGAIDVLHCRDESLVALPEREPAQLLGQGGSQVGYDGGARVVLFPQRRQRVGPELAGFRRQGLGGQCGSPKVWLNFAALGTLSYGGLVALTGALPRWLAWLGIASGLMLLLTWEESIGLMQMDRGRPDLVWIPTRSLLNQLVGGPCLVWLLLSAGWLIARGTIRPSRGKDAPEMEKTDA